MKQTLLVITCLVLVIVTVGRVESRPRHSSKKPKAVAVNNQSEPAKTDEPAAEATTANESSSTGAKQTTNTPANADPKWEFFVTPYLFLARLDGTVGVQRETADVHASFRDIFRNLDFAMMGAVEARKGNWSVNGDAQYMKLSGTKITPNPLFGDIEVKVKEFILDGSVGYRVLKTERGSIDVLAGARLWHVKPHLTFQPRIRPLVDVEQSKNWVDPLVGARGVTNLSPRVFLNAGFDIGGFGINSDFTGQAYGGLGFQVKPRVALLGGYRYLRVDYVNDNFIFKTAMSGLTLGAKFKL